MTINVLPLKGLKSFAAYRALTALLFGYKMLPAHVGETYEEWFPKFAAMDSAGKEKVIRQALLFVQLTEAELEDLACFATNKHGVPHTSVTLAALDAGEIHEILTAVCMAFDKVRVYLVTPEEKKN